MPPHRVDREGPHALLFGHLRPRRHSGSQGSFRNSNYGDWNVGASIKVYGVTVGIYGTGANAQDQYYTNSYGKSVSANRFVAFIQTTFRPIAP